MVGFTARQQGPFTGEAPFVGFFIFQHPSQAHGAHLVVFHAESALERQDTIPRRQAVADLRVEMARRTARIRHRAQVEGILLPEVFHSAVGLTPGRLHPHRQAQTVRPGIEYQRAARSPDREVFVLVRGHLPATQFQGQTQPWVFVADATAHFHAESRFRVARVFPQTQLQGGSEYRAPGQVEGPAAFQQQPQVAGVSVRLTHVARYLRRVHPDEHDVRAQGQFDAPPCLPGIQVTPHAQAHHVHAQVGADRLLEKLRSDCVLTLPVTDHAPGRIALAFPAQVGVNARQRAFDFAPVPAFLVLVGALTVVPRKSHPDRRSIPLGIQSHGQAHHLAFQHDVVMPAIELSG